MNSNITTTTISFSSFVKQLLEIRNNISLSSSLFALVASQYISLLPCVSSTEVHNISRSLWSPQKFFL